MAKAIIGGRTFEVRPFKLRELELAAPAMDRVNAGVQAITGADGAVDTAKMAQITMRDLTHISRDFLEIVAVGMIEYDPGIAPVVALKAKVDELSALIEFDELAGLRTTYLEIQREAKMRGSGERKPASPPVSASNAPAADTASSEPSGASSQGLSPPVAGTVAG